MTKWLRGAVVVLILANAAVFALWMMHDPLFTSLQHVVNGVRIESFRWWQFHQWWNMHR
jgi:hypothetical protein